MSQKSPSSILKGLGSIFGQGRHKTEHFEKLVRMAQADGQVVNEERALLEQMAQEQRFSVRSLTQLLAQADSQTHPKAKSSHQPDVRSRFQQLYDAISIMVVDGRIAIEESRYCRQVALDLGYASRHVDELIESVIANIRNGNGLAETQKRVSRLLS